MSQNLQAVCRAERLPGDADRHEAEGGEERASPNLVGPAKEKEPGRPLCRTHRRYTRPPEVDFLHLGVRSKNRNQSGRSSQQRFCRNHRLPLGANPELFAAPVQRHNALVDFGRRRRLDFLKDVRDPSGRGRAGPRRRAQPAPQRSGLVPHAIVEELTHSVAHAIDGSPGIGRGSLLLRAIAVHRTAQIDQCCCYTSSDRQDERPRGGLVQRCIVILARALLQRRGFVTLGSAFPDGT